MPSNRNLIGNPQTVSADEATCRCSADHNPNPRYLHRHHIVPLYMGGAEYETNVEILCPTGHDSVHWLIRQYEKHDGQPPWDVRRKVGPFFRDLAARAFG